MSDERGLGQDALRFARNTLLPVRHRYERWHWNPLALCVWAFIGLCWLLVRGEQAEARECAKVGGRMVQTGTQTVYVYNSATETTMPTTVSITECVLSRPLP